MRQLIQTWDHNDQRCFTPTAAKGSCFPENSMVAPAETFRRWQQSTTLGAAQRLKGRLSDPNIQRMESHDSRFVDLAGSQTWPMHQAGAV